MPPSWYDSSLVMLTLLVAKPPSALYSAADTLRTRYTKLVMTGPEPTGGTSGSRDSTRKRVVLWCSSSTSPASVSSPYRSAAARGDSEATVGSASSATSRAEPAVSSATTVDQPCSRMILR